jgi:hypothetical protein
MIKFKRKMVTHRVSNGLGKKLILDEGSLQFQSLPTEPTREWIENLTLQTNCHLVDENGKIKSGEMQTRIEEEKL